MGKSMEKELAKILSCLRTLPAVWQNVFRGSKKSISFGQLISLLEIYSDSTRVVDNYLHTWMSTVGLSYLKTENRACVEQKKS